MKNKIRNRFLIDSSETGRFVIRSLVTKRTYFIESIGKSYSNWGDLNPATGKIEGGYGDKYRGSIDDTESLITKDNGFDDIKTLGSWGALMSEINKRDSQFSDC